MSSEFMRKTAAVLEKMADYLDEEETRHQEGVRQERQKTAESLREKIALATGEELSSEVLQRVVESDQDVLEAFTKIANRVGASPTAPDEPGEVGDIGDNDTSTRDPQQMTKEAAAESEQRFLDWIMS